MRFSRFLALLLMTMGGSGIAYAQSANCVSTYMAAKKSDQILGIAATDAERHVSRVAQSIGLKRPVIVVPCTSIQKAYAWPGEPGKSEGEYIIYNPTWVREVLGKDEVQAIALFGHELGHFYNADFTSRKNLSRQQQELDADRFAGCAVARTSGDFAKLEDLLSRLRLEKDAYYPDRLSSIESAKEGFKECGGIANKKCRLAENGVERWGFETTVSRNSNWRGGGGSQPGYCAELQAQLRQEYPDAQETDVRASSEDTRDSCRPLRCIQYQYQCTVTVRGRPVFRELESKSCP